MLPIKPNKPLRVMWLLNHTSARKFEIPMLQRMGISQIYLPKIIPEDPAFRSASIDHSLDAALDIPKEALDILNAQNWYQQPSRQAWNIANQYFDILFFIVHHPEIVSSISKHWQGLALWRAYGLPRSSVNYTHYAKYFNFWGHLQKLGKRFYFAQAYQHLATIEDQLLQEKQLYLPLGMHNTTIQDNWTGINQKILFVCPDIGFNPYYKDIYNTFTKEFSTFDYSIAGSQPISVNDPKILGFVDDVTHKKNMIEHSVMFYHSTEPNHIHFHPFEAIKAGMPLIFMAKGMLDQLGGKGLPGRCTSFAEARKKIKKIISGDQRFIAHIKQSQIHLLEAMNFDKHLLHWQNAIAKLQRHVNQIQHQPKPPQKNKRIAIILPVGYRGGSLRGAKLLIEAIYLGAKQAQEKIEIVFAYLDQPGLYTQHEFDDLPDSVKCRTFHWKQLNNAEANRAMAYANLTPNLQKIEYCVPDDGINHLQDCDLWLFISDRIYPSLLPIKPCLLVVYDYLQRYQSILNKQTTEQFTINAHQAEAVLVTTRFTQQNAAQFAGVPNHKIIKLPMLAPKFEKHKTTEKIKSAACYFIWTTNAAPHKNHDNTAQALDLYYTKYQGKLKCYITGVNTNQFPQSPLAHLHQFQKTYQFHKTKIKILGELDDCSYQNRLKNAAFLLHSALIDNGTFCVLEAAQLGTPSLSSNYPAMQEIQQQFELNMQWMDPHSPDNMAQQLKAMENNHLALRQQLVDYQLDKNNIAHLAIHYWQAIRDFL